MSKKWISPLEKMMAVSQEELLTVEQITQEKLLSKHSNAEPALNSLIFVDPKTCKRWHYKDRPENEMGDIDELAEDLRKNGQIQPVIIRPIQDTKFKYELLIGERRWRAALKADIQLTAIIKIITDSEAAILQATENDKRKNLSDFAKAMSYKKLIDDKLISTKDLEFKLNKSQSYIRTLLSFTRISKEFIEKIGDLSKISARTAYEIARWEEKGDQYKSILLSLTEKIKPGDFGEKQIATHINYFLTQTTGKDQAININTKHHFSFIQKTKCKYEIIVSEDMAKKINLSLLEEAIRKHITDQLKESAMS